MFSSHLKDQIDTAFAQTMALCQSQGFENTIEKELTQLPLEEQYLMKYIYGSLPLSDIGDYPFATYLSFARHSLYVRENTPWGKKIPMDLFLTDVVFPRINNEKIEDHRKILFDLFYPAIEDIRDMAAAVIAVNYKSAEYGTYRSPSRRTASPLTFLRRTFGRCGEESTFLTAALRSLSIPARQIYTPHWPHCDDCHAWTEAWVDGEWRFFGACEPEPILDKGWFNAAAARGMLIHCRNFGGNMAFANTITKEGPATTLSRTEHYAATCTLSVKVVDGNNVPVKGAKVSFELINYARFASLSDLYTDEKGGAKIVLGRGSVNVHIVKDGLFTELIINTAQTTDVTIDFSKALAKEAPGVENFDMIAPPDGGNSARILTPQEREVHKGKLAAANEIRQRREDAIASLSDYTGDKNFVTMEGLQKMLEGAVAGGEAVLQFLNGAKSEYNFLLLKTLDEKDYVDLDPAIMESHVRHSLEYEKDWDKETFVHYILAPRISFEEITDYRHFILNYFDRGEQAAFKADPAALWQYIEETVDFVEERNYPGIVASPAAVLETKEGNELSKAVLFVAALRTLGVPARLNPLTKTPEYKKGGAFVSPIASLNATGTLALTASQEVTWAYTANWSLGRLENGVYETLHVRVNPHKVKELALPAGNYRLITVNRLPNGNTLNKKYLFEVEAGKTTELSITLRDADFTKMLIDIVINDFTLTAEGQDKTAAALTSSGYNLLLWLGEGEEPTEHIITEMIDDKEIFNTLNLNVLVILRDEKEAENRNIQRLMAAVPQCKMAIDKDFYMQEPVARNLYVDPGKLPLVMLGKKDASSTGFNAKYAFSGYNVGMAGLIAKLIKSQEVKG